MTPAIKTWKVTGKRWLPDGQELTLSSIACGSSLERAQEAFLLLQRLGREGALHPEELPAPWALEELTFDPLEELT